jgi:uncharacterized protein YraI
MQRLVAVRFAAIAIATALVLVLGGCTLLPQAAPTPTPTPTESPTPTPSPTLAAKACPLVQQLAGGIEGRIGYPSSLSVPLVVYAIRVDRTPSYRVVHYVYSLTTQITTYTMLGIEPGTYVVIAAPVDEKGQPKAGALLGSYTPAVGCGLTANCTDHSPMKVTVGAGATSRGIDILDWPEQPKSFPAFPTGGEPFAVGEHLAVCNPFADEVNLRSAPGTSAAVVRTLANGTALDVTDGPRPSGGYDWYAVKADAATGWVVGYALRR